MTIRKFLLQITFIFALIIGLTACEKDPITDPPIDAVEQTTQDDDNTQSENNDAQLKSQADCEELLAELLETYTEEELAEMGIDPETFCDDIEWEGEDDEWDDIDWEMECDSIAAMYADELEAFGFDPETFCEDIFDGVVVVEIDLSDITAENCDSLVAMYAEELALIGIDLETFCDELDGGGWDPHEDDDIWVILGNMTEENCDTIAAEYADELAEVGIDPETLCDEWFGNGGWDDDIWDVIDEITVENCDTMVIVYADALEAAGFDTETFCEEWFGDWNDDWDDWGEWDDVDWSMDCDSLVATYGDLLEEWGFDLDIFCDEWGDYGDWDYGNAVCCIVTTECGVLAYAEPVEVVAENGQITVYNENGEVLDSIECEGESVEVECHGG